MPRPSTVSANDFAVPKSVEQSAGPLKRNDQLVQWPRCAVGLVYPETPITDGKGKAG
jgi:hypothetical protein